jgi:hypothetical protein
VHQLPFEFFLLFDLGSRHVQRRPPEAPVRSGVLKRANNVKSGRGRPKLTWDESVQRDLKEWNCNTPGVMVAN